MIAAVDIKCKIKNCPQKPKTITFHNCFNISHCMFISYWVTPENSQFTRRFPMFSFQKDNIVKFEAIIHKIFIKLALNIRKLHSQVLNTRDRNWNKRGRGKVEYL